MRWSTSLALIVLVSYGSSAAFCTTQAKQKMFADQPRSQSLETSQQKTGKLSSPSEVLNEFEKTLQGAVQIVSEEKEFAKEPIRSTASRVIAGALAKAGFFDRALQFAQKIGDELRRFFAFRDIAEAMVDFGDKERFAAIFDQVLQVARNIKDDIWRSSALRDMAEIMAKAGYFDRALQIVREIDEDYRTPRHRALMIIAEKMSEAGLFDQALKIARQIDDKILQFTVLCDVAEAMAEAGNKQKANAVLDQALKIVQKTDNDEFARSLSLCLIAGVLVKLGDKERARSVLAQALKSAQEISDETARSDALCNIAQVMAEIGDKKQASSLFDQALQIVLKEKDDFFLSIFLSSALRRLAVSMAEVGFIDRSLQVAGKIKDESERNSALCDIAKALAETGDKKQALVIFDQALKDALKIPDERERSGELGRIAMAMVEVEFFDQAIQLAQKLGKPYQTLVFSFIFEALAMAKQIERLYELGQSTLLDLVLKLKALALLIGAMRKEGMIK